MDNKTTAVNENHTVVSNGCKNMFTDCIDSRGRRKIKQGLKKTLLLLISQLNSLYKIILLFKIINK